MPRSPGGSAAHILLRRLSVVVAVAMLVAAAAAPVSAARSEPKVDFWLTILHNNDGESQVVDAGSGLEDFGGAARFKTVVDNLKREAAVGPPMTPGAKRAVVMISSGDNFLAGPEFNVGLMNGVPFYDTIAMELIGYDAVNLGNHDFDFGPDVLADFIDGYKVAPPYVSANLDFSGEPRLQAYVDAGVIVPSTVIKARGELIGVIGLETPNLPFISSPRNVEVSDALTFLVQAQVDRLEAMGVDKIILSSHLQNIENEMELVEEIDGVDVVIAGGGDELLANDGDLLIPGDEGAVYGGYPQMAEDEDGTEVPIVTTSGEYRYVGKLVVGFDKAGNLLKVHDSSGPVRVATGTCNDSVPCGDAVMPDPMMQAMVVDPVEAGVAALGGTVIGTSAVDLDGLRNSVRSMETNEGNLIADALFWWAEENAGAYGVAPPTVALQNSGGIRNNTIIPAGDITILDTFDMAPFPNFVSMSESISRQQFKEILENAVACTQSADFANPLCGSGRFTQVSGFSFSWSAAGTAMVIDVDGSVVTPGTRVLDVTLADGTAIVIGGVVQAGAPINIVTNDFSARGGDQWPFGGAPYVTMGATYQQALQWYIEEGLSGVISAGDYPEGGEGRIVALP
jgi:2',3'-cyclic-nucleotide 2'-phosphodiesterase (5'-nucleotidase family)